MREEREDRRPKKPEWKDYARRYLVRAGGVVRELEAESASAARALSGAVAPQAVLMGTHETQAQACKRLGWA